MLVLYYHNPIPDYATQQCVVLQCGDHAVVFS